MIGAITPVKLKQGPTTSDCSLEAYMPVRPVTQAFVPEAAPIITVFAGVPNAHEPEVLATQPPAPLSKFWKYGKVEIVVVQVACAIANVPLNNIPNKR